MRSTKEILFLVLFFPIVIGFYLIYKYPLWFVTEDQVADAFYWWGKSTSFWYSTVYTALVCTIAARVVLSGKTPYGQDKTKELSPYQKKKFTSIFFSQLIFFYLVPFILPSILSDQPFWNDSYAPPNKDAYVYVYNGFRSAGGFVYVFLLVPVSVWFFGKRYCSWFCACGNLAEAIGVTRLGRKWVMERTPRSALSRKLEAMQYVFLGFAILFGLVLFLDSWQIITAPNLITALREAQDLGVDLIFGALIGVGAYPLLGSRIWCRYGCPLAGGMRLFGKFSRSRFAVMANERCKGLNLCTTQCPMGIDVASYAHEGGRAKQGRFSLERTPCIGCGGCVDICPVQALSFKRVLNPHERIDA